MPLTAQQSLILAYIKAVNETDTSKFRDDLKGKDLLVSIVAMNNMYRLPVRAVPSLQHFTGHDGKLETAQQRLDRFLETLKGELSEYVKSDKPGKQPIRQLVGDVSRSYMCDLTHEQAEELVLAEQEALTHLADWFADIMVFVMSEAMKFGIDVFDVLKIVMGSNFSKLGADGKPIYDANGKFQKGPNYKAPEEVIREWIIRAQRRGRNIDDDAPSENARQDA